MILDINGDEVLDSEEENKLPKSTTNVYPNALTNKKKSLVTSISNVNLPPVPVSGSIGATPPRHNKRALNSNFGSEEK